jgi:hypothetical protein
LATHPCASRLLNQREILPDAEREAFSAARDTKKPWQERFCQTTARSEMKTTGSARPDPALQRGWPLFEKNNKTN